MSEQELNRIIGENILKYIELRGYTQADVAEYVGVSEAAVSQWCKGKKLPRMSKIDLLCKMFRCTRTALMSETGIQMTLEADKAETLQRIYDRSRILFDAAEDATPEELEKAAQYIEFLKTQR